MTPSAAGGINGLRINFWNDRVFLNGNLFLDLSSICTIFAESEVLSLLSEGREVPDIVAGLHRAIARRLVALVEGVGLRPPVAMTGGGALNAALRHHLADLLGTGVSPAEHPQTTGALGAALLAAEEETPATG